MADPGDFAVSTACLYLQKRFARLTSGPMSQSWTEGIRGDLWKLARRTDLTVTWIRSHIPEDEVIMTCVAMGWPNPDFVANDVVSRRAETDDVVSFVGWDD